MQQAYMGTGGPDIDKAKDMDLYLLHKDSELLSKESGEMDVYWSVIFQGFYCVKIIIHRKPKPKVSSQGE